MRVLICPDKFAGTASAPEAAAAIADGWREVADGDELTVLPLADGGPGMLDALEAALGGERVAIDVFDPLGRKVTGEFLRLGEIAYIESAQACGLHLLDAEERDPLRANSFGLGQLMLAATERGARCLVIGLGGSATNDGGAGMLTALGMSARDAAGRVVGYGGAALAACHSVDGTPLLRRARLVAA
ncbi:MAG TPA: glycerate kinase, partial [Stackebrandtia sp.]|uniref:glycerate kinase n=1 Tax=Stackebrandtia sp. TaxID=2023065 RepID=UPI002D65E513